MIYEFLERNVVLINTLLTLVTVIVGLISVCISKKVMNEASKPYLEIDIEPLDFCSRPYLTLSNVGNSALQIVEASFIVSDENDSFQLCNVYKSPLNLDGLIVKSKTTKSIFLQQTETLRGKYINVNISYKNPESNQLYTLSVDFPVEEEPIDLGTIAKQSTHFEKDINESTALALEYNKLILLNNIYKCLRRK